MQEAGGKLRKFSPIPIISFSLHFNNPFNVLFDPDNKIVKLCADGMTAEGHGQLVRAKELFDLAWKESCTDFEKFTAAHFVARHQESVAAKLRWDEIALEMALKADDETINPSFPSLYLNIGKCHEDLNDYFKAREYYQKALSFLNYLPDDGYGNMIRSGVMAGIERTDLQKS